MSFVLFKVEVCDFYSSFNPSFDFLDVAFIVKIKCWNNGGFEAWVGVQNAAERWHWIKLDEKGKIKLHLLW